MIKAILGFVAFIVLIVFIVVMIARSNDNRPSVSASPQLSTAASSDAEFSYTESGPIVAEENHFRINITVNKWSRTIRVYRGYQNNVVASSSFNNNEAAFADFLSALERSGYTTKRATRYDSEAGLCPLNRRFVFESDQFGEDFRSWTTNCQEKGNFGGRLSTNSTLFEDQIPDYNTFISNTHRDTGLNL